jgi:hypothetical protein
MALTKLQIINRSLTRLGAPTITALDGLTREAEVMEQLYDHIFEAILTETTWNFAIKDIELSLTLTTPTDPNYTKQYELPVDYLQTVKFYNVAGGAITGYARQGSQVLANVTRLFLKYTFKPAETELPAWFINYLVLKLAHNAQEALIGIGTVQDRLFVEISEERIAAYKQDNRELTSVDALAPSSYVSVRL